MALPKEIIAKLEAEFDQGRVKLKKIQGRPDAEYLESYDVINKANEVFGYGGWGTQVINVQMVPVDNKTVCIATVQLNVDGCLSRQDVGVVVSAGDSPQALETAAKGAVSDGIKRNFRHFGKQFGNDLYAKDGDAPKGKAAKKKPEEVKSKAEHASVQYWRYVRDNRIDEDYAKKLLAGLNNAFEQALEELKNQSDD